MTTTETTPETPVKGDYNGDGKCSVADVVLLARLLAEDPALTADQVQAILLADPDLNGDAVFDLRDIRELLGKLQAV